jgi:hypothetical protein
MFLWLALMVGAPWVVLEGVCWPRTGSRGVWVSARRACAFFLVTFAGSSLLIPFAEMPRVWQSVARVFCVLACATFSSGFVLLVSWLAPRMRTPRQ